MSVPPVPISADPNALPLPDISDSSSSSSSPSSTPVNPPQKLKVFGNEEDALKDADNIPSAQNQPSVIPNGWRIIKANSTTVYLCIKDGIAKDRDLYMSYPLEELAKQISIHAYQKSTNSNSKTNFSMADVSKMIETYEKKPVSALSRVGNGLTAFGRKLSREKFPTEKEQVEYLKKVLNDIVITTQAHQLGEVANQIFASKDKDGEVANAFSLTVSGSSLHSLSVGNDDQNKRIKSVFDLKVLTNNLKRAGDGDKEQHGTMLKTAYQIHDLMNSITFNSSGERPTGLGAYISWPPKLAWKAKIKEWDANKNLTYLKDVRDDREKAIKKARDELIELTGKNDKELSEAEQIQKQHLKQKLERLKISQIRDQEFLEMGVVQHKSFRQWASSNNKDDVSSRIKTLLLDEESLDIDEIIDEAEAYKKQQSQSAEKVKKDDLEKKEETEKKDDVEDFEEISHYRGNRALLLKQELEDLRAHSKESLEFIQTEKSTLLQQFSKLSKKLNPDVTEDEISIYLKNAFDGDSFKSDIDQCKNAITKLVKERQALLKQSDEDNEKDLKALGDRIDLEKQKIADIKEHRELHFHFKNLEKLEKWISVGAEVEDDEDDEY